MTSTRQKQLPIVLPEKCSDKTLVDSVVVLFNDYMPSSSAAPRQVEEEKIIWVHFEECHLNDIDLNNCTAPLVLLMGTTRSLQVWSFASNGEATLLYCHRGVFNRCAQLLPTPEIDNRRYISRQPILALCEASGCKSSHFFSLQFFSLRTNDVVVQHTFSSEIISLQANKRFVMVGRTNCLSVISSADLLWKFNIETCSLGNDCTRAPFTLGSRWLAFADNKKVYQSRSEGGDTSDDACQPIATTVMNAKKKIWGSLSALGSTIASSLHSTHLTLTGSSAGDVSNSNSQSRLSSSHVTSSGGVTSSTLLAEDEDIGMVTVVDLMTLLRAHASWSRSGDDSPVKVHEVTEQGALVAHFQAHRWSPVRKLQFDSSGVLLLTAASSGHTFHLFRISCHPFDARQTAVHHLYTLVRGSTPCEVLDMSISRDSRWVCVTSDHGTSHLFAVTPYGGPVTVRTHSHERVVNRTSRYHKSAGIDEMDLLRPTLTRGDIPAQTSQDLPGHGDAKDSNDLQMMSLCGASSSLNRCYNTSNPRLPPYPRTCTINPNLQLRQSLVNLPSWTAASPVQESSKKSGKKSSTSDSTIVTPMASLFARSRCFLPGSSGFAQRDKNLTKRAVDSLFIMNSNSTLIEYELSVLPGDEAINGSKIYQDGPIRLEGVSTGQWRLPVCSQEIVPPLSGSHPLLTTSSSAGMVDIAGAGRGQGGSPSSYQMLHPSTNSTSPTTTLNSQQQPSNPEFRSSSRFSSRDSLYSESDPSDPTEPWVSQVEITTHMGPHRRLWMGPQFTFKLYQLSGIVEEDSPSVTSGLDSSACMESMDTLLTNDTYRSPAQPQLDVLSGSADNPPRTRPLSMPARRSHAGGRLRNASVGPADSDSIFIEAGSLPESSGPGSLSSLTLDSNLPDNVAQNISDAMNELDCPPGPSTRVVQRAAQPGLFISEEDFPNEDVMSSAGSSPVFFQPNMIHQTADRLGSYAYTEHNLQFPTNSMDH